MYRSRRRLRGEKHGLPPSFARSDSKRHSNENPRNTHVASPDPVLHAKALIEGFGSRTALQIAQFNAQLAGPSGRYWVEVLDSVVEVWGRCH